MNETMQEKRSAIVIGGKTGLLGRPLTETLATTGFETHPTSRADLDPFDRDAVARLMARTGATHLFNTVAYTAVDAAEDDTAGAYRLNRDLPALLGRLCGETGVTFVHYSTDFVFDGTKGSPYVEEDAPGPQSVYGASKLAGEQAVVELGLLRYQILRTAWLFGPGKKNFVSTILTLAASRPEIRVVADQIGSPTYTLDLAGWSVDLALAGATGLFHATGAGHASWCELAAEAVAASGIACRIVPIDSEQYPQKAKRPAYSVLATTKLAEAIGRQPRPWVQTVREFVYSEAHMVD